MLGIRHSLVWIAEQHKADRVFAIAWIASTDAPPCSVEWHNSDRHSAPSPPEMGGVPYSGMCAIRHQREGQCQYERSSIWLSAERESLVPKSSGSQVMIFNVIFK